MSVEKKTYSVTELNPTHHQGFNQDVFNEFEVVALQLLALGAGSLSLLVRIEAKVLGLIFKLTLFQD